MIKQHRKIRTKKQWSYYFKENFLALNPYTFSNLNSRKWEKLKIRFFKQYWRLKQKNITQKNKTQQQSVSLKGQDSVNQSQKLQKSRKVHNIRRFRTYYKVSLKNKHKFKVFFNIKTEKKFKNFLRTSFKYKKNRMHFMVNYNVVWIFF